MKKLIYIFFVLSLALLYSCSAQTNYKTSENISRKIVSELKDRKLQNKNIVIGRIKSEKYPLMEFLYRDKIISELTENNIKVIDRRNLKEVFNEDKLIYMGIMSGKLVNLKKGDLKLSGEIIENNEGFYISINIYDLYTEKTIVGFNEKISTFNMKELNKYLNPAPAAKITDIQYEPQTITIFWEGEGSYFTKEYKIYRRFENSNWELISTQRADYINDNYAYKDNIQIPGFNYYYKIISVDYSNKETAESNTVSIFAYSPPEKVSGVNINYDYKKNIVFIYWNKNKLIDFDHYEITDYTGKTYNLKDPIFTQDNLPEGKKLNYTIISVLKGKIKSKPVNIELYTRPLKPKIINYSEDHGKINITFENESEYEIEEYEIYRNNELITSTDKKSFIDTVPITGIEYEYKIIARYKDMASEPLIVRVKTTSKPGKVKIDGVETNDTLTLIFSHENFVDFNGYNLIIYKNGKKILDAITKEKSYVLPLEEDEKLVIKVASTNERNEYSEFSTYETYGPPLEPQINVQQENNKIKITAFDTSKVAKAEKIVLKINDKEFEINPGSTYEYTDFIPGQKLNVYATSIRGNKKSKENCVSFQTHSNPALNDGDLSYSITKGIVILMWKKITAPDFSHFILTKTINGKTKIIYSGKDNIYTDTIRNTEDKIEYSLIWVNTSNMKSNSVSVVVKIE